MKAHGLNDLEGEKHIPEVELPLVANCIFGNTEYQYIWVNVNVMDKANIAELRRFNYFNYKTWACKDIKTLNAFLNSEHVG